jgi:hypothetical protein
MPFAKPTTKIPIFYLNPANLLNQNQKKLNTSKKPPNQVIVPVKKIYQSAPSKIRPPYNNLQKISLHLNIRYKVAPKHPNWMYFAVLLRVFRS